MVGTAAIREAYATVLSFGGTITRQPEGSWRYVIDNPYAAPVTS